MNHWHEHFNVLVGWSIQVVFIGQVVTFGHVNVFGSWSSHGTGTGGGGAANDLCEIPTNKIPIVRIATAIDSDSQPVKAIIRFILTFPSDFIELVKRSIIHWNQTQRLILKPTPQVRRLVLSPSLFFVWWFWILDSGGPAIPVFLELMDLIGATVTTSLTVSEESTGSSV